VQAAGAGAGGRGSARAPRQPCVRTGAAAAAAAAASPRPTCRTPTTCCGLPAGLGCRWPAGSGTLCPQS
jgi:hypothetical protein